LNLTFNIERRLLTELRMKLITAACSPGYRDFRFADNDWRSGRPALAQWFEQMMQLDSLASTIPSRCPKNFKAVSVIRFQVKFYVGR
jgi:hypothetical protein